MILIFVLALFFRLIFIFTLGPIFTPDSPGYDTTAWNIVIGYGYSNSISSPFRPMISRTPTYIFFLAGLYFFFGRDYFTVILVQQLIGVLLAVTTYLLGEHIFDRRVGLWSSIVIAINPTLAFYGNIILTETLSIFLLSLTVLFLSKGLKYSSLRYFAASGAVLGILVLCRPSFQLFFVAILLLLVYSLRDIKRILLVASCVVVPMAIVISPWIVRNYLTFHYVGVTPLLGVNMLIHTGELINYRDDNRVRLMIRETLSRNLEWKILGDQAMAPYYMASISEVLASLLKDGYSEVEANAILLRIARENIVKHPVQYLATSVREAAYLWSGYSLDWHFTRPTWESLLKNRVYLPIFLLSKFFLGFVICALTACGSYLSLRAGNRLALPLISAIMYISITTPLVIPCYDRYRLPAEPFITILSVYAVLWLLSLKTNNG